MKKMIACVVMTVCALMVPFVAGAQTCAGRPGPEGGRIQLGLGIASTEGAEQRSTYIGGVSSSLFGHTSGVVTDYDNSPRSEGAQTVSIGYRRPIGTSGAAELCPVVGGSIGELSTLVPTGPGSANRQRIAKTRSASAGVSLGYRAPINNGITLIPAVRASFVRSLLDSDESNLEVSNNYGEVLLTAGLLLGSRFTIYPAVSLPVGLEGANASWGLSFTVSFWQKKS